MSPRLLLWILLGLAQVAAPAWMICSQEITLAKGQTHRFRLTPADPADPFRGRYMRLAFDVETQSYPLSSPQPEEHSVALYASLGLDNEGFTTIETLSTQEPLGAHLRIEPAKWHYDWKNKSEVRIQLPFDRFYLNESRASDIEAKALGLIAEARKQGEKPKVHAVVRISESNTTLVSLCAPDGSELK